MLAIPSTGPIDALRVNHYQDGGTVTQEVRPFLGLTGDDIASISAYLAPDSPELNRLYVLLTSGELRGYTLFNATPNNESLIATNQDIRAVYAGRHGVFAAGIVGSYFYDNTFTQRTLGPQLAENTEGAVLDVDFEDVNFDGYDDLLVLYSNQSLVLHSDTNIWPEGAGGLPLIQTYSLAVLSPFTSQIAVGPLNRDNDIEVFAFRDDVTKLIHIDPTTSGVTASPLGTDGLNAIVCSDLQYGHFDYDGYSEITCLEPSGTLRGYKNDGSGNLTAIPTLNLPPAGLDFTLAAPVNPCPFGGTVFRAGQDQDGNGSLSDEELTSESPLCQQEGSAGKPWLMSSTSSDKCFDLGGVLLQGGYDDNDNGILEASEVLFENDVCNGDHGFQALVRSTPIPPGEECPGGGIQFEIGLDVDRSNFLEEAEVETNLTTCFEVPEAGFNSLVSLSPASAEECPAGGQRIESGLDDGEPGGVARNGILEAEEIDSSALICGGQSGRDANAPVIERIDPGSIGPMGGDEVALMGSTW